MWDDNPLARPYRGPELQWGVKTHITSDNICELMVSTHTAMSLRPEFADSMFEVAFASEIGRGYFVTRQPLSDAKRDRAAAIKNARKMLLTHFDVQQMCAECHIDYPIDE